MRLPGIRADSLARGLVLLLAAAACGHSEPFGTTEPDPLGPPSSDLPRQVTFNQGDDRSPAIAGTAVAFSRRVPGAPYGAPCLAILPAAGGTLEAEHCPPPPSPADTFVSSWLEPARSPDGAHVAFVWRRSPRVSYLASYTHHLVVSPADTPGAPLATHLIIGFLTPGNRQINTAMELSWPSSTALRFLAAYDSIFKVKGGGAARFTDTVTVPRALMEMDLATGAVEVVPGGDGVVAYAVDPDGTLWIAPDSARNLLLRLAPDGSRTAVGAWPYPVQDLAAAGGRLFSTAFAESPAAYLDTLYWLDPATGSGGRIGLPGTGRRLTGAGTGDLVLEIERDFDDGFGAPANLWLFRMSGTAAVR